MNAREDPMKPPNDLLSLQISQTTGDDTRTGMTTEHQTVRATLVLQSTAEI